jgi:DNA-binding response OmpR family regulator
MLLADRTVVIVDPDAASTEVVAQHLRSQGARCFHARDAASAAWGVRETLPDVIVSELELPDLDASALILELRSAPDCVGVPAIGLSANRGLLTRAHALTHAFEKFLAKPTRLPDLTDAICCLLGSRTPPAPAVYPTLEDLGDSLERHDYRRLLLTLNALTDYRYTALLRSDEGELRSVWTFDRERPIIDPFPSHLPLEGTPCARVLAERQPIGVVDATKDELTPRAQQRPEMRAFAGVPWFDEEGGLIGALCHFDPEPRSVDGAALDLLERVARLFVFVNRRRGKSTEPR